MSFFVKGFLFINSENGEKMENGIREAKILFLFVSTIFLTVSAFADSSNASGNLINANASTGTTVSSATISTTSNTSNTTNASSSASTGTVATISGSEVDLDKIVVTPYRYEEALGKVDSSVTVITPGDIANSNARNMVEMLRSTPGVTVRDYWGNGAEATVDIAGFGEQAPLNVLVLVDGRRANNVDLSGVDWSSNPA